MTVKEALELAGLTRSEAEVCFTLLRFGSQTAGEISRKVGIFKPNIYGALERLELRGLVSHIVKNKVKFFDISNPHAIQSLLKENGKKIMSAVPEIASLYSGAQKEEVHFFHGKEGLRAILSDVLSLRKGEEYCVLASTLSAHVLMGPWLDSFFHRKREALGIRFRIIYSPEAKKRGEKMAKHTHTQVRFLPSGYSYPLELNHFGKKAAIIFWEKENPMAVLIENEKIAKGFKDYFELMWKISREKA